MAKTYSFNCTSKTPDSGGPCTIVFAAGTDAGTDGYGPNRNDPNPGASYPGRNDPNRPADANRNNPNRNDGPARATPAGWTVNKAGFTASNVPENVASGFTVGQNYCFACPD